MASFFKDLENLSDVQETFAPTAPSTERVTTVNNPIDADEADDEEMNEGTFIDPDEEEVLEALRRQQHQAKLDAEKLHRQDMIIAENKRMEEVNKRLEEEERIKKEAEALKLEKEQKARERAIQIEAFLKKLPTLVRINLQRHLQIFIFSAYLLTFHCVIRRILTFTHQFCL